MEKKKIAFDGQLFLQDKKTGIDWYAYYMIKNLSQKDKFSCIINVFTKEHLTRLSEMEQWGCKLQLCKKISAFWYKLISQVIPLSYSRFFLDEVNATVFFSYLIPPDVKGKKIVFIHDMAYKAYPSTVDRKTKWRLRSQLKISCRRADKIITVSEFSKQEVIKYLKISESKIEVVPAGVDLTVYHPNYTIKQWEQIKRKYRLPEEYFLYLGTIEPRKNILKMIEAYKRALDEKKLPVLVIAGKKGWMYEEVFEKVKKWDLQDKIIFTGYIKADEAPILLGKAKVFLFPSLYEGFGMPVIEAMACGTPVITSNTTSLQEIAKDAAILVNPNDIEEIKNAMENIVIEDFSWLIEKGVERAKQYTWEKSALKFEKILERIIKS